MSGHLLVASSRPDLLTYFCLQRQLPHCRIEYSRTESELTDRNSTTAEQFVLEVTPE